MLLGTVGEDGAVIPRSQLKAATTDESAYEESSLTMQTAIRALQEVDPFATRRRTALSKSKNVLIGVSEVRTISVGCHSFRKHEVSIGSDSPISIAARGSHSFQKHDVSIDSDSPSEAAILHKPNQQI